MSLRADLVVVESSYNFRAAGDQVEVHITPRYSVLSSSIHYVSPVWRLLRIASSNTLLTSSTAHRSRSSYDRYLTVFSCVDPLRRARC